MYLTCWGFETLWFDDANSHLQAVVNTKRGNVLKHFEKIKPRVLNYVT